MSCLATKTNLRYLAKKAVKIWRAKNQAFAEQNLIPTVKHGAGLVMVWGCMAASGVGNLVFVEGTMNMEACLQILRDNLPPTVEKLGLGQSWVFQQDNDPKHTTKLVKEWLLYRTPKQLDYSPTVPGSHPIEHLWKDLDKQIRKRTITSQDMLRSLLVEEWQKISSEVTTNLINSMPRRLYTVIKAKGKQTKY